MIFLIHVRTAGNKQADTRIQTCWHSHLVLKNPNVCVCVCVCARVCACAREHIHELMYTHAWRCPSRPEEDSRSLGMGDRPFGITVEVVGAKSTLDN